MFSYDLLLTATIVISPSSSFSFFPISFSVLPLLHHPFPSVFFTSLSFACTHFSLPVYFFCLLLFFFLSVRFFCLCTARALAGSSDIVEQTHVAGDTVFIALIQSQESQELCVQKHFLKTVTSKTLAQSNFIRRRDTQILAVKTRT